MGMSASGRFDLDAIKRGHRLSDVLVGSGNVLRPAGTGRFIARCPFHEDREPSLLVDERDGHFHCFGCRAHGDVIDFVMRRDGIGFAEACRLLGALPSGSPPSLSPRHSRAVERRWDRLTLEQQVVMNTAGAIYQYCLWREPRALAYARRRGLADWVIRQCALGYADGHTLEGYLRRRSGLQIAQDLGLLRRDAGSRAHPEFLHGRLVVPELRAGQFIWFIGRRLDDDSPGPKYLALTGERPVLGYERAAGRRQAFLCEGVFDYLVAVAWHLPAFSPCGTAIPGERMGFLARARSVYGILDSDTAGRAGAEHFGIQLGARWHPLSLPDGCDLNDLSQQPGGRRAFFALLAAARSHQQTEKNHGT